MKLLRRAIEAEVIAEFLRNEFYQKEFHRDRKQFEELVMHGDTSDRIENALRRALLFRRRGPMWRELPPDTQWWEVELEAADYNRIFVFPRAHWRKVANGSFLLTDIVSRIRDHQPTAPGFDSALGQRPRNINEFISKIHMLSRMGAKKQRSAVLLIGQVEQDRLLIFEGNHRLTAAMLASPIAVHNRFRVFFGSSPGMARCCWYRTSVPNLARYAAKRIAHLAYDREADVNRVLHEMKTQAPDFTKVSNAEAISETKGAPTNVT